MGRVVHDEIHFIALLLIALFVLRWVKSKLDEEGSTYKALTYLIH